MIRRLYRALLILVFICESAFASELYEDAKVEANKARNELALLHKKELSSPQREKLLLNASLELQRLIIERLAPHWYGTKWGFYGTSEIPGEGVIACGYFVTTLLRDAGVNLERARLAQQAAENIIKTLVSRASIRRFSNKPLKHIIGNVKDWGQGIYIVGLDSHVGFLSVDPHGVYFVHSSYQEPFAVIREVAAESQILENSKYIVLGKLSDEKLLEGWFSGARFETIL